MKKETETILNYCDRSCGELLEATGKSEYGKEPVQIGSYACANYFCYLIGQGADFFAAFPCYDLVIPVFPEHMMSVIETGCFVECCKGARCIVVNDVGLLGYFSEEGHPYRLRLGRLFFRDYKDHRYEEYHHMPYMPKIAGLVDFLKGRNMKFDSIELDIPTMQSDMPDGVRIYLHYPFRQVSVSHICEFASVGKRVEDKFIPDDSCGRQCLNQYFRYGESGYYKIGRNVFDFIKVDEKVSELMSSYNRIITPGW